MGVNWKSAVDRARVAKSFAGRNAHDTQRRPRLDADPVPIRVRHWKFGDGSAVDTGESALVTFDRDGTERRILWTKLLKLEA